MTPLDAAIAHHVSLLSLLPAWAQWCVIAAVGGAMLALTYWVERIETDPKTEQLERWWSE